MSRRLLRSGAFLAGTACVVVGAAGCRATTGAAEGAGAVSPLLGRFEQASLEYERGRDRAALEGYLGVLEEVGRGGGGAWAPLLAAASSARVPALLEAVPDRRALEDRTLALPRPRFPWQARLALADEADAIFRRRGDHAGLEAEAARAGCVRRVRFRGLGGPLPHLDLDVNLDRPPAPPPGREGGAPQTLQGVGCRITVPALEGRPGVRVLAAEVDTDDGEQEIALDFPGPALVRVDGERVVHRHESPRIYGPRWSAVRAHLGRGRHQLEVRLGTYGGPAELRLFVSKAGPDPVVPPATKRDPEAVAVASLLAEAMVADAEGAVDRVLERTSALVGHKRHAVALAAGAALLARDITRPSNVARDDARRLLRRAVELDPALARSWRELALGDLARDRAGDAIEHAERSLRAEPHWWPAEVTLAEALRARGLERDADATLDRAIATARTGQGLCGVLISGLRRAQQRADVAEEERLVRAVHRCDAQSDVAYERARQRGDLQAAERALDALVPFAAERPWLYLERAAVRLGLGRGQEAVTDLRAALEQAPRDPTAWVRLVDALSFVGARDQARATLKEALRLHSDRTEVRQAARLFGLPLPLDPFRLDAAKIIRDFKAGGRRYEAPAVLVLDRTVHRVFDDGTQLVLTHNIVKVQTKDGIQRWGEVQVPEGAEVLALRTHKADGTVREPEEIAGKPTISAPELAAGDFVEWETIEYQSPSEAFAPGFLGERFYFQSLEAPLDRSEYLVIVPRGSKLDYDRRAGAPQPIWEDGPDGTRVARFVTEHVPQLFGERASVPAIEWIPSVRVSSAVTLEVWRRFLEERLYGVARGSPALRTVARRLQEEAGGARDALPARIVRWVCDNIEPEGDVVEPATSTLARGRGNRVGLALALAREAGVDADLVLARPLASAPASAPVVPQEVDDFSQVLVRFGPAGDAASRFVDFRLRRAPLGYLAPSIDGALGVATSSGARGPVRTTVADARSVEIDIDLGTDGQARGRARERLSGWPALEWRELVEQTAGDPARLRQEFEQRWLAQHFPGAELVDLDAAEAERGDSPASGRPGTPGTAAAQGHAQVEVRYTFAIPKLGTRSGRELHVSPTFYLSQLGRRYATEGSRRTTLLVGADVPLDVEARFTLPPAARPIDLGPGLDVRAGPRGEIRFLERRESLPADGRAGPRVRLRRQVRLPVVRIEPAAYRALATELRRVDPTEEAEMRFGLP